MCAEFISLIGDTELEVERIEIDATRIDLEQKQVELVAIKSETDR